MNQVIEAEPQLGPAPPSVTMRSREFRRGARRSLAVVTIASLFATSTALFAGLPPLLGPVVLVVVVVVLLRSCTGESSWTLDAHGMQRQWRAFAARGGARDVASFAFDEIRTFRHDHTLTRAYERVEYLELHVGDAHRKFVITDRHDPEGFAALRDAFLRQAATTAVVPSMASSVVHRSASAPMRQLRSFYATPLAHLVTSLACLATLGLGLWILFEPVQPTHLLRFLLVIAPGTVYLVWRTWLTRR